MDLQRRLASAAAAMALLLAGCASGPPPSGTGWGAAPGAGASSAREIERGVASWYGERHHGRRTASGETFDMNALTAAHKTLAFGTRVRVVNPANGQSVVVRINDRGPFTPGRVIDLSRAAAERIGLVRVGVAEVVLLRD